MGRYELVREIGRGGFGVVWEARDRELGREVALKAVGPGGRLDLREERLLREAEAAARLSHPNIVTLFDAGRSEQGPYLVMELLRGETLAKQIGQGPMTVRGALSIAIEVAKGLAHAHEQGVFHRDLTPGNVFLCQDGTVKVLDLGMAHAFGRRKLDGGTPSYMAPEQWREAPEDERTDVFALGVILFQMLSGATPFPNDGGRSVRSRAPAPRLRLPSAPALEDLMARMLAKDPTARIRDAGAVLAEFERIAADLANDASPDPAPPPARVPRSPRPRGPRLVAASIGVLPFADMSPERDHGYFADGIAEEILNALANVEGLKISGRTSSFSFRGTSRTIAEIGRALNVSTLLEGSVRKAGGRIRVTAKLVKASDGFDLWSQTFDREMSDVFAVQDEIARAVVDALRVRLLGGRALVHRPATRSREAYDLFLLGRDEMRTEEMSQVKSAVAAFEKAVAIDERFFQGRANLAGALILTVGLTGEGTFPAQRRRALEAAERAVALAPDQPDGYAVRAQIRSGFLLDFEGARLDVDRALALGPGDAGACARRGRLLIELGDLPAAIGALERATDLDPLSARTWTWLGRALVSAGHHPRARAALSRALEIAPRGDEARHYLCADLMSTGEALEALSVAEHAAWPRVHLTGVAIAEHELGHAAESQAALEQLIEVNSSDGAYQIAEVYAWRGDADQAFAWLERAHRQVDTGIGWIKTDPLLRKIHNDERFTALLRALHLPPD